MDDPFMPGGSRKKFTPDGTSKPYHGHSVICHVPVDSPLRPTLNRIRAALAAHPLAESILPGECILPETSFHMTVFICVRHRERAENVMPRLGDHAQVAVKQIGLDGDYNEWLEYTISRVEALSQDLPAAAQPPYVLDVAPEIPPIGATIGLRLHPRDNALWNVREALSAATGIRHDNHDSYKFHVTLAYTVRQVTPEEEAELRAVVERELVDAPSTVVFPRVALCSFENMQNFEVKAVLGDASEYVN
ncbi:hypothetical protein ASPVEDRAFT_33402 [Aspergillus versicolor CBS 583.65]|uniref:DUF1868 domain-containing protein n=1 Tax=Aspergillus versicolor CBS 583.65 TaxID=1036611 RepID=A0A1L9Q073_ASPVE|nr:uncharacterized protein ASPVEDRAFT_33402 [Aspergillus versicolor CBS 583.65]OJJ07163.1 hypothetical protein ASPVEDRAFT_33402 [Aspergillus versicolor CBS 583.65]